jgi:lipoate-protein ligase B
VNQIEFIDAGTMKYGACLELQHALHEKVAAGDHPGAVIFVEHEPVITFGKNADPAFLHFSEKYLHEQGVDLFHTDRGGEVTAHMPGQLVVYPILNLPAFRLGARDYVCLLEKSVIATLKDYGVSAATHEKYPGVWAGDRKVCAVGVRIKNRTSMHGIAFNICNDLALFSMMTPCGIQGKGVCSLTELLADGRRPAVTEAREIFRRHLLKGIAAISA